MVRPRRLSRAQARRVAISAAGLGGTRPAGQPDLGHVLRAIRRMGVLQIDSVNVVERAHHLTLFSRLGAHETDLLWRALDERRIFEYWARMASFSPMEHFPLFRPRMAAQSEDRWSKLRELQDRAPGYVEAVYREVEERGPLTASELEDPGKRSGPWWGWAAGKIALEFLFSAGRVTVAHRRNFARYYDLTERVVPPHLLESDLHPDSARRQMIGQAARAMGVATARDLADYYRIRMREAGPVIDRMVRQAELVPAEVEGWGSAYLSADARVPRRATARTLVNPFDPYMWNRERVERLHGFRYRIEIYVPAPKRVFGYYVFPFLLDDELVARVDLKADRRNGVLRVPAAYLEDGADPGRVVPELAAELYELAGWLGLTEIEVGDRGDLSDRLGRKV